MEEPESDWRHGDTPGAWDEPVERYEDDGPAMAAALEDETSGYAAVLGDVIGSRQVFSHARLIETLNAAFDRVNQEVPAAQPFSLTVGDEFQGLYQDLETALRAALLIRLQLLGRVDIRIGVGWGLLATFNFRDAAYHQDGPAWWAARQALDRVDAWRLGRESARQLRTLFVSWIAAEDGDQPGLRARFVNAAGMASPDPPAPGRLPRYVDPLVNAFLICRDEILGRMDERDALIVLELIRGRTQESIARSVGISQSAVSQRLSRNGGFALLRAEAAVRSAV